LISRPCLVYVSSIPSENFVIFRKKLYFFFRISRFRNKLNDLQTKKNCILCDFLFDPLAEISKY
jgi:hypothetical protein